jgi:hypothetical protein
MIVRGKSTEKITDLTIAAAIGAGTVRGMATGFNFCFYVPNCSRICFTCPRNFSYFRRKKILTERDDCGRNAQSANFTL